MSKVKTFLTVLFSAIGVLGAREFYKPRNIKQLLEWKGVKLASDSRAGNSMFFENEEELKGMKIENADALGGGCNEKFKVTNLSDEIFNETKKFCSDNPKSIMARIIRDGDEHKVIGKDDSESFSINYLLAENAKEVLDLIGVANDGHTKPQADKVGKTFSKGCEGQKRIKVNNKDDLDIFARFKKRCYGLGVKTASDLIKKQGKKPIVEQAKYRARGNEDKFKYAKELKQELLKSLTDVQDEKKKFVHLINKERGNKAERVGDEDAENSFNDYGGLLYERGCKQNLSKRLLDDGMITYHFKKIIHRCAED